MRQHKHMHLKLVSTPQPTTPLLAPAHMQPPRLRSDYKANSPYTSATLPNKPSFKNTGIVQLNQKFPNTLAFRQPLMNVVLLFTSLDKDNAWYGATRREACVAVTEWDRQSPSGPGRRAEPPPLIPATVSSEAGGRKRASWLAHNRRPSAGAPANHGCSGSLPTAWMHTPRCLQGL